MISAAAKLTAQHFGFIDSAQLVRRWESGETSPSIDNAALLAQFYAVSLDELYGIGVSDGKLDVSGLSEKQLKAVKGVVEAFG